MRDTNGTELCMQCFHAEPHDGEEGKCTWKHHGVYCGCYCPERGVLIQEDAAKAKDATIERLTKERDALLEYARAEESRPHSRAEAACWCGEQRRAALKLCEERTEPTK